MFISTKLDWCTNTANQHHDDNDVAGRNGEEDDISSDVKKKTSPRHRIEFIGVVDKFGRRVHDRQ